MDDLAFTKGPLNIRGRRFPRDPRQRLPVLRKTQKNYLATSRRCLRESDGEWRWSKNAQTPSPWVVETLQSHLTSLHGVTAFLDMRFRSGIKNWDYGPPMRSAPQNASRLNSDEKRPVLSDFSRRPPKKVPNDICKISKSHISRANREFRAFPIACTHFRSRYPIASCGHRLGFKHSIHPIPRPGCSAPFDTASACNRRVKRRPRAE